ncbi:MAG: hypothetical protein U0903_18465 [Planctomycetales bacterium]
MYVRFGAALVLVVLVSLWGVALEKHNLDLKRRLTQQSYQQNVLQEHLLAARLQVQQMSAPTRTVREIESTHWAKRESSRSAPRNASSPPNRDTRQYR